MPTIEIPPLVRFFLYLVGALGGVIVAYTIAKGWAGDAEHALWNGIASLLFVLAAAKTTNAEGERIIRRRRNEAGTVVTEWIVAVSVALLALAIFFGLHVR